MDGREQGEKKNRIVGVLGIAGGWGTHTEKENVSRGFVEVLHESVHDCVVKDFIRILFSGGFFFFTI